MSSSRTDEPPRAPTAAPGARQASITGSDTRNTQVAQDTQDTQNTEASQDTQSGDLITLWGLPRIVRLRDLERIKENARGNPTPVNLALRSEAHYGLLKPGSFLTMDVVSLGMLILDDIIYTDPTTHNASKLHGITGGAGAYAVVAARIMRCQRKSKYIGWAVHTGSDFPPEVRKEIESWGVHTRWIETPERLTTRAKNVYSGPNQRDFCFSTDKIQINPDMLDTKQLMSKTYHMICSPQRCIDLVKGIMTARRRILQASGDSLTHCVLKRPIFVWEPMEDSCKHDQLPAFYEAMKYVDVFSPNGPEFAQLMGLGMDSELSFDLLEANCNKLLDLGFGRKPSAVVVRLGARGCHVGESARHFQFNSYHSMIRDAHKFPHQFLDGDDEPFTVVTDRVVDDVTGGGNAFLGGFCIGLVDAPEVPPFTTFEAAAAWGTVAASFAVEQAGMPKVTLLEDGHELWNGEPMYHRLNAYNVMVKPPPSLPKGTLEQASPYRVDKVLGNGRKIFVRKEMECMKG